MPSTPTASTWPSRSGPSASILTSQWAQYVADGMGAPFNSWLEAMLTPGNQRFSPSFWVRHRHDELVDRWAAVVGPGRVTVVVVDSERGAVLRGFERLLGLTPGTLVADPDLANRSLTLPETEAVRRVQRPVQARGAARSPALQGHALRGDPRDEAPGAGPGMAGVELPAWALPETARLAREIADGIAGPASALGDLDGLARVPDPPTHTAPSVVTAPPQVAAAMAMGVLFATGTARSGVETGPETREAELERVPTYVLGGAVVMRTLRGAGRRLGNLRGGRHGLRHRRGGANAAPGPNASPGAITEPGANAARARPVAPRPTAAATRMVGRSDGWRDPREMELTISPDRAKEPSLLVPEGSFLVHIGPHKTGTTSLQAALFGAGREAMLEQGVRHIGPVRNPSNAVRSVTGQSSPYADEHPPPIRHWRSLVKEVNAAHDPRLVISSEFFAWAKPDVIRRVVDDLGGDRVPHIAVTLRSLGRVMPSMWQQNIQSGAVGELDTSLFGGSSSAHPTSRGRRSGRSTGTTSSSRAGPRWWGPTGLPRSSWTTGTISSSSRTFEGLLGLRDGTLEAHRDLANRSLTLPEVEAVRAFNVAFKAERLDRALHARVMRFGAAQQMKAREPSPDEPRVEMSSWALDHVDGIARSMVDAIAWSGSGSSATSSC